MLPFGNISERIFTHTASHYACKHTTILAVWQGRKCRLRAAEPHPPFSFPRKKTGGVTVQRGFAALWAVQSASAAALQATSPQCEFSLGGCKGGVSLFEKEIPLPYPHPLRGAGNGCSAVCCQFRFPYGKTISPEAKSCRGRREHENADAARSVPPARRCWTRRGNSQCPSPW